MISPFMVGPFILMYHSIADGSDDPYTVSVGAFKDQISWLRNSGYRIVPLSNLVRSMQAKEYRNLERTVVLTFDDGYGDFLTNALPVLLDGGMPATVFLVTHMLGARSSWNQAGPDLPLMSEDEVRFIKTRGIALGSHTATHKNLTLLDGERMRRQLRESRDRLLDLGETFPALSYPWGQWSRDVVEAVSSLGYRCAAAVGQKAPMTAAYTFTLPRITMRADTTLTSFQTVLGRTRSELEIRRRYRMLRESGLGRWAADLCKNPSP